MVNLHLRPARPGRRLVLPVALLIALCLGATSATSAFASTTAAHALADKTAKVCHKVKKGKKTVTVCTAKKPKPPYAGTTLNLVGYSTPKPAYTSLVKSFQATTNGTGVNFTSSFGPSTTQTNAVIAGLPADIINTSADYDMQSLVNAGLVSSSWSSAKYGGFVTDSVVVFVVRHGNPKGIANWSDLIKPGVQVIVPNPLSSGGARWDIMAAYGAQLALGDTASQAQAYLAQLYQHIVVQPSSASGALSTFISGKGDVVLDYEDNAWWAEHAGYAPQLQYIVPPQTILIQNPIAVLSGTKHKAAAQAFVNFLLSTTGQTDWAKLGYRPVEPSVAAKYTSVFPTPSSLFTINEAALGGWAQVNSQFFSPSGIWTQIAQGG